MTWLNDSGAALLRFVDAYTIRARLNPRGARHGAGIRGAVSFDLVEDLRVLQHRGDTHNACAGLCAVGLGPKGGKGDGAAAVWPDGRQAIGHDDVPLGRRDRRAVQGSLSDVSRDKDKQARADRGHRARCSG